MRLMINRMGRTPQEEIRHARIIELLAANHDAIWQVTDAAVADRSGQDYSQRLGHLAHERDILYLEQTRIDRLANQRLARREQDSRLDNRRRPIDNERRDDRDAHAEYETRRQNETNWR